MIWLLGGYMWLFIHRPFEFWPALGALHVERIYMLATLLYWAFCADKGWVANRLNRAFACFAAVVLVSWLASPFAAVGAHEVEDYFKIAVFYVLVVTTVRDERDLRLLVMMFLGAMGLYLTHSLWEFHNGRHDYKMMTYRMIGVDTTCGDPNAFAATIVYSLPMIYPLWRNFQGSRLRWTLVAYSLLAITCILLTGSRTGFVGLCTVAMVGVMLSKHRLAMSIGLLVAACAAWFALPADHQNRILSLFDSKYGSVGAGMSADSRREGWRDGVRIWEQYKLLGVGPGAFGAGRGYDLESHQLYGQVLGELGSLGAIAFAMILAGFFGNQIESRRMLRAEPWLADDFSASVIPAVTVAVVLLLLQGFGGHNLFRYTWLWYGAFQGVAMHCLARRVEAATDADVEKQPWTSLHPSPAA